MMGEQTIKCPICGKPYKFYMFSAADQSACPACVAEAAKNSGVGNWKVGGTGNGL